MEISKPQPDTADDSIDDNFDDFGFKFLCDDDDESSKSILSSTSNSNSSESAPYSRFVGNVKPINGFWVIKESPPIRELKEPRLSSQSSRNSGPYSGKTELKGGYRKDTQYVPVRPHIRDVVEHSIQSSNNGKKVRETKLGVCANKESVYSQKPWIGELKVRDSPNLEIVYDANKTCMPSSSRKSDSFESRTVESVEESCSVDGGMIVPSIEMVKDEPESTRVNNGVNVHNFSWQFSPRDPRINKELPESDGTVAHKSPVKHSPRDPRIRILHDQKGTIPPCKIELHDIKKYSPRDPRIKRFQITERHDSGQSSEDAHVSVSCNVPHLRNLADSAQRTTYNVEWGEEGPAQGEKYETFESQKTDKESDDTGISNSCHDQNQSLSLTKLKICRVAHSKNMYVSSFCQETSPPKSTEKVDGGLEAENRSRMEIERPKHDLPNENDTSKFNEKAEKLAKLGEKYCQAKVLVRKLQDFDIHKLANVTVETGSQEHFQCTVGPQMPESSSREKIVAISKLNKRGKRRGPRLRKELTLFSKAIPAKDIEDEEKSYQYVILPSDYIPPAVKPNKSDLKGNESIQSCQPEKNKDTVSNIATTSIDRYVKEELHHDTIQTEFLVDGEFEGTNGDSFKVSPGNANAASPDVDTVKCNKDPQRDGNLSIEEENHRRNNDILSTESSLLASTHCPNDSDEKDDERAAINVSEDIGIDNHQLNSESNVGFFPQVENEMGDQIPLTESITGKDIDIIDENNLICQTQRVEEEIDTCESLESLDVETQCASCQEDLDTSKEVKTTEIEKPTCENHESEMEASSSKDVDQSHKDDAQERIMEEVPTDFQVNEKQVESDAGKSKEQSKLPTPALIFLPHSGDSLLQDVSTQKSNKRHHLEIIAISDDHSKGTEGGELIDIGSLEIISPDQESVVEHLPHKKLKMDGEKILQEDGKREVATISQLASTDCTITNKKMGFYHKKYNRTKLKLPIGGKHLMNHLIDGGKRISKPVSSNANLNARKEDSVSEKTPTKEIIMKGKSHSPEESISPVLDPVVAIEKLRYKLFAEAGVDLSKPSSSLYSGKFQRKSKKKSENEFQRDNKTGFSTVGRALNFENASRLNHEKLSDPGSEACVTEKVGISTNVYEKVHSDAVKTAGEMQSFGNAYSAKAVQIDHRAFHYQRKDNIGAAKKAKVQIVKRKLSEKNIEQSKRVKISLLTQNLTLRSVSKTTRVGYSKDGFVEKTIVRKQKPDKVECQISSSYGDEITEQPIAKKVETKKEEMQRNQINGNNSAQVKKGKGKSVSEDCSKENANINMKDMLIPKETQQFEEGSNKSNCVLHEAEIDVSSKEFNNHSKVNELEEAENKKQPEELKGPNCIKTQESDNLSQAENTKQLNMKIGNVDTGAKECDEKGQCKGDLNDGDKKSSSDKRESVPDPRKHSKPKPRPAKCVVCGHVFKTKELLKKHHPCRIKQTRTWSQKALRSRPNRVRKEPLPVLENKSKTSKKPRLLEGSMAHRKSKFKVVKGKTRRKLLQAIRELMEKRKPAVLPHMHILCEQLPENEQFLFQLGLLRKERTVDDKTHLSPSISAAFVKAEAFAVEDVQTSHNFFHDYDTKPEEGYSICEDEKSLPPVLEKISSNFSEELSSSITGTTVVGVPESLDPPILEPILVPETFSTNQDSSQILASNSRNMTSDSPSAKQLTERHFTDFIEEMPETVKEKIDILKEKGTSECKDSFSKMKSMIKTVKSPNLSPCRSNQRHFTDAISDTEVSPSMSNTVCALNADAAEENVYLRENLSGEITFAHIRNMLTLERERKFSKHSLMKLSKDLATLLTSVKSKSRHAENESTSDEHNNDPERTSKVSTARNLSVSFASIEEHSSLEKINSSHETPFKEASISLEGDFSEINDLRDPKISAQLGKMGKSQTADQGTESRSCITDNIMGMLNSLEDKGNLAENMKNVLQLLAANLGIQSSEIIPSGNSSKEQEGIQQDDKRVVINNEGDRSENDKYCSDLEIVGRVTADDSEPLHESVNSVSVGSERGNKSIKALDHEVPEDSCFVSDERFNKARDNDVDRVSISNANDDEEHSLKEQVLDLLKNMVYRVEDEELKFIKFMDEVSTRALVTFGPVAENHDNLYPSHPAFSDTEQKDGSRILASEESDEGKGGVHQQLDDSKLVIERRNEDDVISFSKGNHSENVDNPGDGVEDKLSVKDRTDNSKEDRCLPDKELELVPSSAISSRFHSEESESRCEYQIETSKAQEKICTLENEYRDEDVLVHENTYLDEDYSTIQVMNGTEYFLEEADSQSKMPMCHDKVKERWCPYTGYAIEPNDTNEDPVTEDENNWQYRASLAKKEHPEKEISTDGHSNEACRGSIAEENTFVVIPDISGIHSKTVSNDDASRDEKEMLEAYLNANDTSVRNKDFHYDSGIGPGSKKDSELKQIKNSVVSCKSGPTLDVVKHDSMHRISRNEIRNVMSEPGFSSRSEKTDYKNDKTLVENHSSVISVWSSEKLEKSEEEYLDKEAVLSGIITQDIPMVKNQSVFKSDEHTANAEDTVKPLSFDRHNGEECYQKDQDVTNLIQGKKLHQQMNHLSSADKRPVETDVFGDDQKSILLEKNTMYTTSNSSYVEYKSKEPISSVHSSDSMDYSTKPSNTTVTAVDTHESGAGCEELIYQVVEERKVGHSTLGIELDEMEKEDQTMIKGIASVDEQVNASVTGNSHNYSENHHQDDSESANSLETNSKQRANESEIKTGKPNAALHIPKFPQELGARSSPVALRNAIAEEHQISQEHEMEYDNIAMKANYVECELKFSSEESQHHQKVLEEHLTKGSVITDDSQSVSGIQQLQLPILETSSKIKSGIATDSDFTAIEVVSHSSKENKVEQSDNNIAKESLDDSAKAETIINKVCCYKRKRDFIETVSEGSDIVESDTYVKNMDMKGGKEALAWSKDVDEMQTKSHDSFIFDRFVTNRYKLEDESLHVECKRPEEFPNNEQREDSSDTSGAVKEVITFSGNDKELIISSCNQQSFQVAVRSEKVLTCFVNIDSEAEATEKNQPEMVYDSQSSSSTNEDETGGERDTAQQILDTQGIDSVASTRNCKKDEIDDFCVESSKVCSSCSGDMSMKSPVVNEPEQYDDDGCSDLNNKQIETSKEKLSETEAGTEKFKSSTSLCQDSVDGEQSHWQSSEVPKDDSNHAVPNIDSHGENLHFDLKLHGGMEQVDKDTGIVVDSYLVSYKDIPNSSLKPVICDSAKSDASEGLKEPSEIVSNSNFIDDECQYTAGAEMSDSAGTQIGSGNTNKHKDKTDIVLSESLKNEFFGGLTEVAPFEIPEAEIVKESDHVDLELKDLDVIIMNVDPERCHSKYKVDTSDSVEDESENVDTNIPEPKDINNIVFNADPVQEFQNTSLKHCHTGLITKCDRTLLLKQDCDVESNEEFHKTTIISELLLSSDLAHSVSFSSLETNPAHTAQDQSTTLDNIASSDDRIKQSQYTVETHFGSESTVYPEHDRYGTHHYSNLFEGISIFQNIQQQTTDAAQEVADSVTSEAEDGSQHECSESKEIPELA